MSNKNTTSTEDKRSPSDSGLASLFDTDAAVDIIGDDVRHTHIDEPFSHSINEDDFLVDEQPMAPQPPVQQTPTPTESKSCAVGESMHMQGELTSDEDITIKGCFDGKIVTAEHNVSVGATGCVRAEIQARTVVVAGELVGNVTAGDLVEVAASGSMQGDIRAARVVLADGARFRGNIDMGFPGSDKKQDEQKKPDDAQD